MAQTLSLSEPRHPGGWSAPAADWRTQAAIVFGLNMAHLLFESVRTDQALLFGSLLDWAAYKGDEILRLSMNVITATVALQFIDRLRAARPHRTPAAVLSMVVAVLAGAALSVVMLPYEPVAVRVGASASTAAWFWYTLWTTTMAGGFALVAVDGLHGRQQAATHLAQAQEQGRIARQQLAAAQLSAIQARVDPQLLFDMLATVKRFYELEAPRAERLLDDLSAFLRAALPRLRSERSTLAVEFGLVQAYVRLLSCAGAASIELLIELPAEMATLRFPAGVLLPLLVADGAMPRRVTLVATAQDQAMRVRMSDTTVPAAATLERLRRSLSDLYGDHGKLHVRAQGAGAQIQLEVPRESA